MKCVAYTFAYTGPFPVRRITTSCFPVVTAPPSSTTVPLKLNRFSFVIFSVRFTSPSTSTSTVMSGAFSPVALMYSAIASMQYAVSRVFVHHDPCRRLFSRYFTTPDASALFGFTRASSFR